MIKMTEMKKLLEFYNKLGDQESKDIFELMYKRLINMSTLVDWKKYLISLEKKWTIADYDDFRNVFADRKVIIFGAGVDGKFTFKLLKQQKVDVIGFCDNNSSLWGKTLHGLLVVSPDDLRENYRDTIVVVASQVHYLDMFEQLIGYPDNPFPKQNIWMPRVGLLYATTGKQYFDCPGMEIGDNEVFVDAGFFHGETSREFIKLCNGKYNRIVAFEADENVFKYSKNSCSDIENIEIHNCATWNVREKLYFKQIGDAGSRIDNNAASKEIQADSIDNIMAGREATFIKLDVEGAEYNTLLGAEKTIKKYKPKIACSIYHKPQDIVEIPLLLMEYRPDYKYYIRHYTTNAWETVLYAY